MANDEQAVEVVITAPDSEWLRGLIGNLVQQHLCAAAHLSQHETVYRWQGEIHSGSEAKATLYTRADLIPGITRAVQAEHQYEVPHVSATPITTGNPDYLQWISTATGNT